MFFLETRDLVFTNSCSVTVQKQTFAFTVRDKAIQANISEKGEYIGLKSCVCVCVLSHSLLSDSLLSPLGSSVHGIFQARVLGWGGACTWLLPVPRVPCPSRRGLLHGLLGGVMN